MARSFYTQKSICSFCMESYWNWNIWCVQCWILYDLLWRWCRSVSRGNFVVQAWSHILSKFAPQYIYQTFLWQMGRQDIDILGGIKGFVWASGVFCECLVLLSWLAGVWWWGLDHVAGTSYPSGKLLRLSESTTLLLLSFRVHTCVKWKKGFQIRICWRCL